MVRARRARESPPWTCDPPWLWTFLVDLPRPLVVDRCVDLVDRHVARFECDSVSNPALPSHFLRRRAAPNRRGVVAAVH